MEGYSASFIKGDGSERKMNFVRLKDLPLERIPQKKTESAPRAVKPGMELVWDIDAGGFRMFNWRTILGEAQTIEVEVEKLPPVVVAS